MYLKTLTIKGFKSFAETTTLELEPGITVVVGPNGSGKSNIVDAVAWVLGAQGPRTVRSSKMDDVIFAGTARRAALGRAEVSLTIDNASGALGLDLAEITIRRTLFRNGDSEYAINGASCRLLDVQELLSDSGVGRQQHVIVSQGQLDTILNARPEDRRLVIEEAAGVLKYRRRKEKAERRLESTEANLLRLADLVREVRRQIRPLERQAEAVRRHGSLLDELQALRLHLAGRELSGLTTRLQTGMEARNRLTTEEAGIKAGLAQLDVSVLGTESELSAMGAQDLSDILVRVERLGERARGMVTLLAERRRGIERDRASMIDQAVIASLEAESARLAVELASVEAEAEALLPEVGKVMDAETELAAQRAGFDETWGSEVSVPTSRAGEIRARLVALRQGVERGESETARLNGRLEALARKAGDLDAQSRRVTDEASATEGTFASNRSAAEAAIQRRSAAEADVERAEVALREADADRHAWSARAEALGLALDEARARAGAESLSGVDGVLGTLLDLVEVDEGWELAFEAAVGPGMSAVVVGGGVEGARRALQVLEGTSGAILAMGAGVESGEARAPLPPELSGAAQAVRPHVRAREPRLGGMLDALLSHAVMVSGGWAEALDVAVAHPALVVVTRSGDCFGPYGWRVGQTGAGATGAALDEAAQRAATAAVVADAADAALGRAREELRVAREIEAGALAQRDDNQRRHAAAITTSERIGRELRDLTNEIAELRRHHGELVQRTQGEQAIVEGLAAELPLHEAEEARVADQRRAMHEARTRIDERVAAVGALRTDLEVRATGFETRRSYLQARLSEVNERLSRNVAERAEAEERRVELDRRLLATDRLSAFLAERARWVEEMLGDLHERRRLQSEAVRETTDRLDRLRRERGEAERRLEAVREHARRSELEVQEIELRVEAAVDTLRRDLDREPEVAMATPCPPLPEGVGAPARLRDLERELRLMGPINPLALEEHAALQERHDFLEAQLEDVKASRRELAKVIKVVDAEIESVFAAAFVDVSENFTKLFETLFPGGQGSLRLTDPSNLLETGIEVEARPSGKNVRKLSLLSGGERSLTAMAFLFAVFRSRPSPFYLMDEVEAALDDVNLHRFLDLLGEFRQDAQLLIVSHQKRTMEVADTLYGVTMEPGGSSRVVSERVTTTS
ncbi:MAG: chromosome segregation protein SMC [Acidimicrobiales bacterium]